MCTLGIAQRKLFRNCRIYTQWAETPTATEMLVEGDRIAALGSGQLLQSLSDSDTCVIDLGGSLVVPGLFDSHTHFVSYCENKLGADLVEAESFEQVLNIIEKVNRRLPQGLWLRGGGWDKNLWPQGRFPPRTRLDEVTGARPAALTSKDGHALWANTAAIRLAQVDEDTPDPPGGRIVRQDGSPQGVFLENAMEIIREVMPPVPSHRLEAAVLRGQKEAHSMGLTGLVSMEGPRAFSTLSRLNSRGQLTLRVRSTVADEVLTSAKEVGVTGGLGDGHLRIVGVKVLADGALGSQTAYMKQPYCGRQDSYRGILVTQPQKMDEVVETAVQLQLMPVIHAIGDAACEKVLEVFSRAREKGADLRMRMEHAQLLSSGHFDRMSELGVIASVQPMHAVSDRDLVDDYWGERGKRAYAFQSLLDAGVNLAFGSDAPVDTLDPVQGIRAAVFRRASRGEQPWYPGQCLSPQQAVYAYTRGSAYAVREENLWGTLRPGYLADFTVLTEDFLTGEGDVDRLWECGVRMTVVGGRVVYDAEQTVPTDSEDTPN